MNWKKIIRYVLTVGGFLIFAAAVVGYNLGQLGMQETILMGVGYVAILMLTNHLRS